jgi:phage terminase large subunit
MKTIRPKRLSRFRKFLYDDRTKRINVIYGGAGSGKSYSVAQLFIRRLYEENDIRMLVLRKTLPALRITAYQLIRDVLREYNLPFALNKSEMLIRNDTNEILFKSLDDPEKIKSYEGNYLWIEEATEITYTDFTQLNLRLRRKNSEHINQMYLTFNPISRFHWLNTQLIENSREDIAIHHSTYKDNPFLSKEYIAELEGLTDENFYKIYTLGEFGELKNIIFSNYVVEDFNTTEFKEKMYGIDFGYNNENAIIEVGIKDNEYYLSERLYETHMTNQDLIEKLKEIIKPRNSTIIADSAEPARIDEIKRAGFDIHPADKSVKDGIDFIKSQKLHVNKDSINLINELRGYKYKEDKDGNVLEDPVKFRDHLMDAMRYCMYLHGRIKPSIMQRPFSAIPVTTAAFKRI